MKLMKTALLGVCGIAYIAGAATSASAVHLEPRYIVFDAVGSGTQTLHIHTGDQTSTFTNATVSLILGVNDAGELVAGPDNSPGATYSYGTTSTGFFYNQAFVGYTSDFSIVACYDNPTGIIPVVPVALDPSCSTVKYSRRDAYQSVDFEGTLTSYWTLRGGIVGGANIYNFTSAVPEASTWALMLSGFALTGYALRRRRSRIAFA